LISFSASAAAAAGSASFFSCVCPFEPIFPNVTLSVAPSTATCQNLLEEPSESSKRRMGPPC
jgi:hypothetical protein